MIDTLVGTTPRRGPAAAGLRRELERPSGGGVVVAFPRRVAGGADKLADQTNFRGLVLGCIEAKFCKQICV